MKVSQKMENRTTRWPSNSTPWVYIWKKPKTLIRIWSQYLRAICTPMFTAALFTIAKIWKKPKCPSMDEWIKKMWYMHVYIVKCYSDLKEEILPFSKWMSQEDIMLSEISQTEKDKYCMIPKYVESKKKKKKSNW